MGELNAVKRDGAEQILEADRFASIGCAVAFFRTRVSSTVLLRSGRHEEKQGLSPIYLYTYACTHVYRAEQDNINHPAYGTWTADFMLRESESRAFLGKYLNDPRVPWRHKRREMIAIAGIIPVAKWLAKIKQRSDVR